LLGLTEGSYEAYCLDQAIWYFGVTLENELEMVGHKPSKEERKAQGARERVLERVLGLKKEETQKFMDPMLMFAPRESKPQNP